jgi:diguanylate cyclase (GGDEF)-like protein/putative nucleotidyltransferase with HDIG domain
MTEDDHISTFDGRFAAGYFIVFAAACAVIFAVIQAVELSIATLLVLGVSGVVAWLGGRYETSIPKTDIRFRPKDLITFWAVIWLGIPSGILISLTASFAGENTKTVSRAEKLLNVSIDVVSCLASAAVFFVVSNTIKQFAIGGNSVSTLISSEVLVGAAAMGVTHFVMRFGISSLLQGRSPDVKDRAFTDSVVSVAASYSLHLFSTLVLYSLFSHFGVEIGILLLPLVITGHLAHKMHTGTLEAKTREITEASRLHLATVEALATAIDARDQVGMGHVRRTQIYALGIGKALGLSEDELHALRAAALLHDIGKLAVPDHILNKPGRLTSAELEKTKIHSSVGASILANVGFPYPVVPTVKYHHECWDGTGYPEALRGKQIPITARILAVADVYDTLRGARPYREAVASDRAVQILRSNAGTRFDPFIVQTLIDNLAAFHREIEAEGLDYESTADTGGNVHSTDDSVSPHFVQQIKRANREVFTLYSLAKEFGAAVDIDETLKLFTAKIRDLAPYDTCVVYLLEKGGDQAVAAHVDGANQAELRSKTIAPGDGATGYVLESRQPVQNVDPALDFAFSLAEFGRDYTAMASLPLISNDALVGAVSLYSRTIACYADEHIRLLETVSRIAADSIVRAKQLAEAENYALTDPMTGLPNSRGLQNQFEKESKRADRNGSTFQVLVLDLDGFKAVNDTHGHKVGDTMLREVAEVIGEQLREYDFLARYGGDEFVAIIPDTETIDVLELSRRIERAVCDYRLALGNGVTVGVGVSIGSASYPAQGETFDQVVIAADKAMYITKAIHRQRARHDTLDSGIRNAIMGLENPDTVREFRIPVRRSAEGDDEGLLLELDDRHILNSKAVN